MSPKCLGNPIVPNRGVCDPHIRIFGDRAYLYATHDRSPDNNGFFMDEWGIWSSPDLVTWHLETVLKPEQTYLRRPFDQCWATDAASRNGKYYLYFSEANVQAGVVVGDTPVGPWHDPLGAPLLPAGLTTTHEYDICVFTDSDDVPYIVFGVWEYHIARLGEDMISLAEKPRRIEIAGAVGPYGPGLTDDKPFLHRHGETYYLSWGCFYATSASPYGPYEYRGTIMDERSFMPGTMAPTWPHGFRQGRHGSFFEWRNQWYFAYCDISQTGNRYFRDTFISYVHYQADGGIAPIRVDLVGVGQYDPTLGPIQAEDYSAAAGVQKVGLPVSGFGVVPSRPGSFVSYPNVAGLADQRSVVLTYVSLAERSAPFVIEVAAAADPSAPTWAVLTLPPMVRQQSGTACMDLAIPAGARDFVLRFPSGSDEFIIDSLMLAPSPTIPLRPHPIVHQP